MNQVYKKMKSSLLLLVFLGALVASDQFSDVVKSEEEPALQDDVDIAAGPKEELKEEEDGKNIEDQNVVNSPDNVENQADNDIADDSVEKRWLPLSYSSCGKLKSRGLCTSALVARVCKSTCCNNYLSNLSCKRVKSNGQCHTYMGGFCRKTCGKCWFHVYLRSEGCNDPGIKGCGQAFIKVNGHEYSLKRRGHNIVVLDNFGLLVKRAAFDTNGDITAGIKMRDFIYSIRSRRIVLIAVQDDGSRYYKAADGALMSLGAVAPFSYGYRSSWAFVGQKYNLNFLSKIQRGKPRYKGPTIVSVNIPTVPL